MNNIKSEYILKVGIAGERRLSILNEIYNGETQNFIKKNGIAPGQKVMDIGCGTGDMTCWLASQVGPTGQVYAIDQSEEQLKIVQAKAEILQLNNIIYCHHDINELNKINEENFDIIYSRFLYIHLNTPVTALQCAAEKLKSDGTYIAVEPNLASYFSDPDSKIFQEMKELKLQLFGKIGADPVIADKMFTLFHTAHLKLNQIDLYQPVLQTPVEKSSILLGFLELKEMFIKTGLLNEFQYNERIFQLENHLHHCHHIAGARITMISSKNKDFNHYAIF